VTAQTLDVFLQIREILLLHAQTFGFEITEENRNDAFGSHSIMLEKEFQGIRLIWDGKDSEFSLTINSNTKQEPLRGWKWMLTEKMERLPWDQTRVEQVIKSFRHRIETLNYNPAP